MQQDILVSHLEAYNCLLDTLKIVTNSHLSLADSGAMEMAIKYDQAEIIEFFKSKPSINLPQNVFKWIMLAIESKSTKCIVKLADWASQKGRTDVIDLLYEEGINFSAEFSPILLRNAVSENNLELLKYLVRKPGIDLNQNQAEVFDIAAGYGYIPIVHWLLSVNDITGQRMIKLSVKNNEAIIFAASKGDLETIQILEKMPELHFEMRVLESIGLAGHFGRYEVLEYFALYSVEHNYGDYLEDIFSACAQRGIAPSYVFSRKVTLLALEKAKEGLNEPLEYLKALDVFDPPTSYYYENE